MALPSNLNGRPPRLRASRKSHPPLRYRESQPYIVALPIPRTCATISGLCPACMLLTARFLSSVSVLRSNLRASFVFMHIDIPQTHTVCPDNYETVNKTVFLKLRQTFEKQNIHVKSAHELSLQFLNRLMFLYFISKKRWLNDDPKFIRWYWNRYKEERRAGKAEGGTFYENWLRILFFEAFNNQYSHPRYHPQDVGATLAVAPYLKLR